jgi:hypothetical protein
MAVSFRIHPAIGIARLGNSPTSFYIAPDQAGVFPIDCDQDGNPIVKDGKEVPITKFKDDNGAIRRQAARFRVFVYDDVRPEGREVKIGDTLKVLAQRSGQLLTVRIDDIRWTVYLANKKSSWYEFAETDGEHGYGPNHPLRNATITDAQDRQQLIIDPGPRSVRFGDVKARRAAFTAGTGPTSFPPPLAPNSIASLGELIATQQDNHSRLLVLGGFGNSGSMLSGFGNPKIETYANNDGWFDDVADGPVSATFDYTLLAIDDQPAPAGARKPPIAHPDPAWAIVGYPRYVPQIVDIVTMDDLVFDLSVRNFAYVPYMFGIPPFDGRSRTPASPDELDFWRRNAQWNTAYRPYFWRDIWPILQRPYYYMNLMDKDPLTGGNPHEQAPRGNFDPSVLSVAPYEGEDPAERELRRQKRQFLYSVLRQPGQENELLSPRYAGNPDQLNRMPAQQNLTPQYTHNPDRLYLMPLLCGDNPLSNTVPSKFFRLTDTMLFLLHQWAEGLFIDEHREGITPPPQPPEPGAQLDRGALAGALGGSFCPGGEASWIMRNPAIYSAPYRINPAAAPTPGALSQPAVVSNAATTADLATGLEPGDVTKYSAVPWQSDFNECTNQPIDITYRGWNVIEPDSTGDPVTSITQLTYWWPAHRPNWVGGVPWSPTAQNNAGDLQMVTAWATLGFIINTDNGFVVTENGSS